VLREADDRFCHIAAGLLCQLGPELCGKTYGNAF
jgi:hypothetical protein